MSKWIQYVIMHVSRRSLLASYREVFGSSAGEVVLNDLSIAVHMMRTTHDPNPTTAAFNEGKRATLLYILKMLRTQPEDTQTLADREIEYDRAD